MNARFALAVASLASPQFRDSSVQCRAFIGVDPVTNVVGFELYTDDGQGNGNLIFGMPLATLIDALRTASVSEDDVGQQLLAKLGA